MKALTIGTIVLAMLLAVPAAAQESPENQIVESLPAPFSLVASEERPLEQPDWSSWVKVFDDGANFVQIVATDYGALEGPELVNTFRGAVNGAEAGFADSIEAEGLELGPATINDHPIHAAVLTSERTVGVGVARSAHYIEGSTGFYVQVFGDNPAVFEAVLSAQIDHSTGERIEWSGAEANDQSTPEERSQDAYDSGSRAGQVLGSLVIVGLVAVGGWFLLRRTGANLGAESDERSAAPDSDGPEVDAPA